MMRLATQKMFVSEKWARSAKLVARPLGLLALLVLPLSLQAWQPKPNWQGAASELVGKTLDRGGRPSAIAFSLNNASSLSNAEVSDIRRALESQLASHGAHIVKPEQAIATLNVTLSENAAGLLWIAEVRSSNSREIVMTEVARNEADNPDQLAPALTLHKELIWSQYEPILDFALWENRSRLLVLERRTVSLYRLEGSRWKLEQSQPIPQSTPSPMDIRGRLLLRDRKFEAFVPGKHCTGSVEGGLTLDCRSADDPWPLAGENSPRGFFSATRNFFTGVLTGADAQRSSGPFFSAANVQSSGRNIWIFAGTDGRIRQSEGGETELRVAWGSNIGGVKSGCGSGSQVLAAGIGDWSQRDFIQAFDLSQGVTPVTSAVEVPGPVTVLWPAADASTAQVVARNLGNGKYEALNFSIGCH